MRAKISPETLELHQKRVAEVAISPSSARRMGPSGTVKMARQFLRDLDLKRFSLSSRVGFELVLDEVTDELRSALQIESWGVARKLLNIFLRDVAYNVFLRDHYQFEKLEGYLELPLDSHVAKWLQQEVGSGLLPRWKSVTSISQELNARYQSAAEDVASAMGLARVHLDLYAWRAS